MTRKKFNIKFVQPFNVQLYFLLAAVVQTRHLDEDRKLPDPLVVSGLVGVIFKIIDLFLDPQVLGTCTSPKKQVSCFSVFLHWTSNNVMTTARGEGGGMLHTQRWGGGGGLGGDRVGLGRSRL